MKFAKVQKERKSDARSPSAKQTEGTKTVMALCVRLTQ